MVVRLKYSIESYENIHHDQSDTQPLEGGKLG